MKNDDDDYRSFISQKRIGEILRLHPDTVRKCDTELVSAGLLKFHSGGPHKRKTYIVVPSPRRWKVHPDSNRSPSTDEPPSESCSEVSRPVNTGRKKSSPARSSSHKKRHKKSTKEKVKKLSRDDLSRMQAAGKRAAKSNDSELGALHPLLRAYLEERGIDPEEAVAHESDLDQLAETCEDFKDDPKMLERALDDDLYEIRLTKRRHWW